MCMTHRSRTTPFTAGTLGPWESSCLRRELASHKFQCRFSATSGAKFYSASEHWMQVDSKWSTVKKAFITLVPGAREPTQT